MVALIAAMRKLLTILNTMLKKSKRLSAKADSFRRLGP
jgi:hypothetical protein